MDERIYMIIAKELAGEAEEAERGELEAWLSSDVRNREDYEDMKMLWGQSDVLLHSEKFDTSGAWNKVSAQINTTATVKKGRTIRMPAWTKYAIGIAAVLLISVLVWKPFGKNEMVTVLADNGNKEVVLPDNSHITLREGSTLKYPEQFDAKQRNVSLEGEAFFEVTHIETQPFVISAGAADVRVLGTSFNVQCTNDEAFVTVATGKVRMASCKNTSDYVLLTPGEKGRLQHNELAEEIVNNNNYLYWKTGVLVFENKPLHYITAEIAKLHKVKISLDGAMNEMQKTQVINISFNHQPLEDMLTELCLVAKCRWTKEGDSYIISAK